MNTHRDLFEAELHALRPHPPSAELSTRIAARLAAARWRRKVGGRLLVLTGLAAAALVLVVFWTHRSPEPVLPLPMARTLPRPAPLSPPTPTFGAYQHALAQSPEAAEALVDRYAVLTKARYRPPIEVRAFPFVYANVPDWLGE